jgi:XRE family aerobic/anaerobic benzoate catabolism transcriptional regulator
VASGLYYNTLVPRHAPISGRSSRHESIAISGLKRRENATILNSLSKRVRELRSRRGMTRKMLSREAEISERHLAQIESGKGNVSIMLLARIAAALNVSLAEILAAENDQTAERQAIERLLRRLPFPRVEELLSRLEHDESRPEDSRRMKIALIGLRGAGKTTLGLRLSAELGIPFIELDQEIEADAGMPLAEIFSLYGQSGFRAIERRSLERVLGQDGRAVISIGGGVVSEKETYDHLLTRCFTIWIKAQPEEHMSRVVAQGDLRAMAASNRAMEDLRQILESRVPLYQKADLILDTSGDSAEASFLKLKTGLAARNQ